MLRLHLMRALYALLCLWIPLAVHGADKKWTAAVSGDYADPARWTGGVPGAGDTASFNEPGVYTVTFDNAPNPLANPVLNQDLFFDAGTATFTSGSGGPYTYRLTGAGGDDALLTSGSLSLGTSGNPLHLTVDDDLAVRGGSTLNVNFGSQVNTLDLLLATLNGGGNGTIVVDGTNSQLNVTGGFNLAQNGNIGTLTYRNSAQGTWSGTASLGFSGNAATVAILNVESNADVTTGNLNVGNGTAAATGTVNLTGGGSTLNVGNLNVGTGSGGASGTVNLISGSTLTLAPAATLTVGTASGSSGTINIGTAGGVPVLNTGAGNMTINATGAVNLAGINSGTINANGNIIVNGGALTVGSGGTINYAPGMSLTVQNGGTATFNAGFHIMADNAVYNVTGAGSEIELPTPLTSLRIGNGAETHVSAGGTLSVAGSLNIASNSAQVGTLTVDGSGSSVMTNTSGGNRWGDFGGTAMVTFSNGGSGTFGAIELAGSELAGTTAVVDVLTGANLITGHLELAIEGGATTSAELNIQGTGSNVTQGAPVDLTVGHASQGSAVVNVGTTASGATLTTGSGDITINTTGSVNIGSGANTGTFNANGDVTINGGTLIRGNGSAFVLAPGKTMTIQNGGQANFTGQYTTAANATYNVTGTLSELATTSTLSVGNGAQMNVSSGGSVSVTSSAINVGTIGGNGSLTVDGAGSSVESTVVGPNWGLGGGSATVTFSNGATGTFAGGIALATDFSGSTAIVDILSGANLTMGGGLVLGGGSPSSATVDVQGLNSTLSAADGIVGAASVINVGTTASGAIFNTISASGTLVINPTGAVIVGSGASTGTLNANGNVRINGGTLQIGSGSAFILASGRTMTIQNGGTVSFTAGYAAANASYNISGAGSTLNTGDGLNISNIGGPVLNVSSQGSVSVGGNLRVGVGAAGTLVVDGSGSSASAGASQWGINGGTGNVTFSNGAAGSFLNGLSLATNALPNSTAIVNILSGADLATGNLTMANVGGATTSATLTIDGAGSTVTPGGIVTIGHTADSTATIDVLNGGALTVGAGGSTLLNTTGTINIDGGTADLKILNENGGTINFAAGSLSYLGDLTVGTGGLLGENLTLTSSRQLSLNGTTTIDAGRSFTLDGGSLSTGSLVVNGALRFDRGTLEITGGTISGLGNMAVNTNAQFRASGVQSLQIIGLTASTITAIGNLTLGDATKVNGFYSNGTVNVGAHTVTLADANDAAFDSAALVTLGDSGSPGTLAAANGLTLDFSGNVTGFGTVDTPDSIATPLTNNGHIAGNSGAEPITLTGYVKGVGTLDNVVITGTDAPGFSPATVVRGSVVYDGTLEIEIGGTSSGSFDRVQHILGAGTAQLGGELDAVLINGFNPALDDSFEIITATGGVSGTFTTLAEELPGLSSGLEWAINYGTNNVVLKVVPAGIPGDYNDDGAVDAADYVVWRKFEGTTTTLPNDPHGGTIGSLQFNTWRANFGNTTGGGTSTAADSFDADTAVPEPSSVSLLLLAAAGTLVTARNGAPAKNRG